jgi:hypothetical protein
VSVTGINHELYSRSDLDFYGQQSSGLSTSGIIACSLNGKLCIGYIGDSYGVVLNHDCVVTKPTNPFLGIDL